MFKKMILIVLTMLLSNFAMAGTFKPIRSTNMSAELINKIQKGEVENAVIEFVEGDRLPINIRAQGDIFESVDSNPTFIEVKKHFFVKINKTSVTISFDGENFKQIQELLHGTLAVNANVSDFPVSAINIMFSAFLK